MFTKLENSKILNKTTYKGFDLYAYQNKIGAWLGYIDVTGKYNFNAYNEDNLYRAPFHGHCTFCEKLTHFADIEFDSEHLIVGCDWCHAGDEGFNLNTLLFGLSGMSSAVEEVTIKEVEENLKGVVDFFVEYIKINKNKKSKTV